MWIYSNNVGGKCWFGRLEERILCYNHQTLLLAECQVTLYFFLLFVFGFSKQILMLIKKTSRKCYWALLLGYFCWLWTKLGQRDRCDLMNISQWLSTCFQTTIKTLDVILEDKYMYKANNKGTRTTFVGLGLVFLTHFMPLISFYTPWKH